MNEENEKKIRERFPFMRNIPFSPTLGVRDGWYRIIWNLCEKIESELQKAPPGTAFEVDQVKEKFGTLRMYCSGISPKILAIIDEAEHESEKTCEVCGGAGEWRNKLSWIQTLCDTHYDEARGGATKPEPPQPTDNGQRIVSLRPA